MKYYIQKVSNREHLTREEASTAMEEIMDGKATEAQIGAFLIGLKMKGEQPEELLGFVGVMRSKCRPIVIDDTDSIDMCGTGGDHSGTFNISTVASFVVAGAGVTVAKHGNRSVSSSCGSADLLNALGVDIHLPIPAVAECINRYGIGFLFAPLFHPSMRHASKPRGELGMKTCFNILGPMTNPAGVQRQLVGVADERSSQMMADVFTELHPKKVVIVSSDDGLDEISLGAPTQATEVGATSAPHSFTISADSFGFPAVHRSGIPGGTPGQNATIALNILGGNHGPYRDTVLANAAMGLVVADKVGTVLEGVQQAIESIDSGKALAKLRSLAEATAQ